MTDAPQPARPTALLVDFGGVMTSDVFAAFAAFSAQIGDDPDVVRRLLATDPEAQRLLVEHESGRIPESEFADGFVACLAREGIPGVAPEGLIGRMLAATRRDDAMIDAVARVRAAGIPTAIVSNSLGDQGYQGFDLHAMADAVVISGEHGVRKPSRRLYLIACEQLGVDPTNCVMVDDVERNLSGAARLGIRGVLHTDAASTIAQLEQLFAVDLSG